MNCLQSSKYIFSLSHHYYAYPYYSKKFQKHELIINNSHQYLNHTDMPTVFVYTYQGCEPIETLGTVDVLRRCGVEVFIYGKDK